MNRFVRKLRIQFIRRLYRPIYNSVTPVHEAALGAGIGMFVGMTPTVGIQMWGVFMLWLIFRYLFNISFDLIIGTALVWISNPFTMFFFYYGFLTAGNFLLAHQGEPRREITFTTFRYQFSQIINAPDASFLEVIVDGTRFLVIDLGYPMLLGSMVFAVPLSVLTYLFVSRILHTLRRKRASKLGLDYDIWREQYVRGFQRRR
jgi:uncharacterized protein